MEKSIGALWSKKGKNGSFFTGQIEIDGKKTKLVAFNNTRKTKDTQPDISIYIAKERIASVQQDEPQEEEMKVEDIPF